MCQIDLNRTIKSVTSHAMEIGKVTPAVDVLALQTDVGQTYENNRAHVLCK